MENLIEELTKVRPDELSKEGLKLFNKINEIIDKNQELEERNKDLQESVDQIYDDYQDIGKMYFNLIEKIENNIEELNKEEQELQNSISDEEREEYSDANISFELMDIEIRRSVLQELLEKRK